MMKITIVKYKNFIKSTNTNNTTGYSGAESLPLIGESFMYDESSSNIHGSNASKSFERSDIIQISSLSNILL